MILFTNLLQAGCASQITGNEEKGDDGPDDKNQCDNIQGGRRVLGNEFNPYRDVGTDVAAEVAY